MKQQRPMFSYWPVHQLKKFHTFNVHKVIHSSRMKRNKKIRFYKHWFRFYSLDLHSLVSGRSHTPISIGREADNAVRATDSTPKKQFYSPILVTLRVHYTVCKRDILNDCSQELLTLFLHHYQKCQFPPLLYCSLATAPDICFLQN